MSKRVLLIGLGGTGKACLTILKERLIETYGQTPDTVVLLAIDTDDLRGKDTFNDVRLDLSEFLHIVSTPGITIDTVFADLASGRTTAYMGWLEKERLDRIVSPSERDIRGGAQQRRPLGRLALFLQWRAIYDTIVDAITRMYGEPDEERPVDTLEIEQSKRLVFIVGSVAGGTGSGFLIDVANLVYHAVQSNQTRWQSVDVSAIIVLPDAFSLYTTKMNDPTNLKPNSYAALRELDRFIRTHGASLPYMVRYDEDLRSITWSVNQPLDHVYLVDTASPSAIGDFDLSGDPKRGVFPVIADFIASHVDQSLGDTVATNRANAGLHYDKAEGWQYSSFNVMTYIFPAGDVIKSFSYRFLREMLARQFLPITDKKTRTQVERNAFKEVERAFSEISVGGQINPGVIQKAIAATRRMDPETPDVTWSGLFNLIALSESAFAEDYQDLEQWLTYLCSNLLPSKEGDYKHEGYDEGHTRLLSFSEGYMDDCLGPQTDPDNEESRFGGEWDKILSRYREALRQRFAEALDAVLLDVLNWRDLHSKVLAPARLAYARAMVATLKDKLVRFRAILEEQYRQLDIDTRIRQTSEELHDTITWMHSTKDSKTFALFGKPKARKAQDAYIGLFCDKMELTLHQRIFGIVLDVLDALGTAERDKGGNLSVLDQIALELENWQATFQEVDRVFVQESRTHEKNREEKRRVKVRRYLTNPEFEEQLYSQPEHASMVGMRVLGQVRGETGMTWQRVEETEPLHYKLSTMWTEEARGAEEIARGFLASTKNLFQMVRENITIADQVEAEFTSPASFVNTVGQVNEPFLRYHPTANGKTMFHERYVSFNLSAASDEARKFLEDARSILRDQGVNIDMSAESVVACTVVEVARGARLNAVDQFVACEPDYRGKLYKGRESLHLFPEEQVATDYEGRIETLDEPGNRLRSLAPELLIAMGDEAKLHAFTLACAYGLIQQGLYRNPETGEETTELFLVLRQDGNECRLPLSQSRLVRELDPSFYHAAAEEQSARLYLNALQNFALKTTEKQGVPYSSAATLAEGLKRRGVYLSENPFTLSVREVNEAIRRTIEMLEPSGEKKPDRQRWSSINARQRVEQYLQPFFSKDVVWFKRSDVQSVRDMGTVMHLILQEEISRLLEWVQDRAFPVILEYDAVLSVFTSIGRKSVTTDAVWTLSGGDVESQFHAEQDRHLVQMCHHFGKLFRCPVQIPRLVNGLFITEIDTAHFMEDVLFERPEARISPRIPLVFSGWKGFGTDEAEILQSSLRDFNHMQSIALLILFDKQDLINHLRQIIVDKMRAGYGIDVVVIGRQEIEDLLDSPNPPSRFRSFVLARIDIARISPYNITGPVVSDLVFSGREEELRTIAGRVGTSSYVLIGGRRFGKTSILLRLHRLRLPAAGFRILYHDCSITPTYGDFLTTAIRDWRPGPPANAPDAFGTLLRYPPDDKPLVLLLDEADKLVPADRVNNWRLFNTLRALANSGRAQVVLSGEHTLRDALRDSTSPLFNFANEMLLGPLDYRAIEELVTRPMKRLEIELVDEKTITDSIWNFTSGHPNVVQRLCRRLIERLNEQGTRRITLDDVNAIIEDPGFQRDDFLSTYWEAATPLEKIISLLMADDENARTLRAVRQALEKRCNLHPKAREVDDALQRLVDLRSILKRTPTGYEFAVEAFPRVVAGTMTLADMLEVLVEDYAEEQAKGEA